MVTGYGSKGPWAGKPGQDLLIQALSGLTYLSGTKNDTPTPFGLAIADMICGAHLAQGILAGLIQKGKTGGGMLVEVSLLESILDFQFELITTFLNDGGQLPRRGEAKGTGHAYLKAPYGIYRTKDSYLALAMGNLRHIAGVIGWNAIDQYPDEESWYTRKDEIVRSLTALLQQKTTADWIAVLEPNDIWCSEVLNYKTLVNHESFEVLGMDQNIDLPDGRTFRTTRCPIRIDGEKLYSSVPAPKAGAHTTSIDNEMTL